MLCVIITTPSSALHLQNAVHDIPAALQLHLEQSFSEEQLQATTFKRSGGAMS